MAIALAEYSPPIKESQPFWPSFDRLVGSISAMTYVLDRLDWRHLTEMPSEQSSSVFGSSPISDISKFAIPSFADNLERDLNFEIAYQALADRRGANATPAGRVASRKVWLDAGADAARWLIDRLRTEQHPETIIGIAETITDLGVIALPIALAELERDEAKPEYAPLVEALAWMAPPSQPQLIWRIAHIIDRYLASSYVDCQVAAVQLTRLLDDEMAHLRLVTAKRNAKPRLREEIEDLLNERFGE